MDGLSVQFEKQTCFSPAFAALKQFLRIVAGLAALLNSALDILYAYTTIYVLEMIFLVTCVLILVKILITICVG